MGEDNQLPLQAPTLKVDQQKSRVDFRTELRFPPHSLDRWSWIFASLRLLCFSPALFIGAI